VAGAASCSGISQPTPSFDTEAESYELELYKTDDFRMYCFKILNCSKRSAHNWAKCPFAHFGERARRRDVRALCYSSRMCPDIVNRTAGGCPRGEACPMSHHVSNCLCILQCFLIDGHCRPSCSYLSCACSSSAAISAAVVPTACMQLLYVCMYIMYSVYFVYVYVIQQ